MLGSGYPTFREFYASQVGFVWTASEEIWRATEQENVPFLHDKSQYIQTTLNTDLDTPISEPQTTHPNRYRNPLMVTKLALLLIFMVSFVACFMGSSVMAADKFNVYEHSPTPTIDLTELAHHSDYVILTINEHRCHDDDRVPINLLSPAKNESNKGWKCALDLNSTIFTDYVECDDSRFADKCADICVPVKMTANAKCIYLLPTVDGMVEEADCTGLDIPLYNCSCEILCRPTNSNTDYVQCTQDDSNWTLSETCGGVDEREAVFQTQNGTILPTCKPDSTDCDAMLLPTTIRIPTNALTLCTSAISLKCGSGTNAINDGRNYVPCDKNGGYAACSDSNCGGLLERNIQCFVGNDFISNFLTKINLDEAIQSGYNNILKTICDEAITNAALTTTTQCDCINNIYCVDPATMETAETTPLKKADYRSCRSDFGFSSCPNRCIGDDIAQFRPVFCRNINGTYTQLQNEEELAASECFNVSPGVAMTRFCLGQTICQFQYFCHEYNSTTPFVNGDIASKFKCSANNHLSDVCYVEVKNDLGPSQFVEDRCIIPGISKGIYYRLRDVQCIVYKASTGTPPNTYPSLSTRNISAPADIEAFCAANLPAHQSPPLSAVVDTTRGVNPCRDQEGCEEVLETVKLSANQDVPEFSTILVNWTYIGPAKSMKPVKLEYAYAVTNESTSKGLKWILGFNNVEISQKNTTFPVPSVDRDIINKFFLRMSLDGSDEYIYAKDLVVKLVDNCETLICHGPNLDEPSCVIDGASQKPKCQCIQPIDDTTFTSIDTNTPCKRTAACDANSLERCHAGGYLAYDAYLTTGNQCVTNCTCPGGQSSSDCSGMCSEQEKHCHVAHGKPFSTKSNCKCQKCWRGRAGEFCEYCANYTAIVISEPNEDLIASFSANATDLNNSFKNMFFKDLDDFVRKHGNYNAKYVGIDGNLTRFNVTSNELIVVFKLVGECTMKNIFTTLQLTTSTASVSPPELSRAITQWNTITKADIESSDAFNQVKTDKSTVSIFNDASNVLPAEVIDCSIDREHPLCPSQKSYENQTITIIIAVVCAVGIISIVAVLAVLLCVGGCWKNDVKSINDAQPAQVPQSFHTDQSHLELC